MAKSTPSTTTNSHIAHKRIKARISVLLATARIRVADRFGNLHQTRALIDQGSEMSMITEKLAQRLHLTRAKTSVTVCGVGGMQTAIANGKIKLKASGCHGDNSVTTTALILPKLTLYGSNVETTKFEWNHIKGLDLADPEFEASDPIDVLLGADVYAQIMDIGLRKGGENEPLAQKTIFGWILSGSTNTTNSSPNTATTISHHCSTSDSLSTIVRRFWEQEELPHIPAPLTAEEQQCEDTFVNGHSRTAEGRYIVQLPTLSKTIDLSETREAAKRTLDQTLKRFSKIKELEQLYTEFMDTYESMNHMEKAEQPNQKKNICYLPHHGVWRESSSTTRLRVVFNGSWRTHRGIALNDLLPKGENLLPALPDLILRWRNHRFVIATEIEKMYRQILVYPDDRDLQRILWKANDNDITSEYRLNTVTYGLACAPFLAIRTIRQLAHDEGTRFPLGATTLLQDVYVDDILTGADDQTKLLTIQKELRGICTAGGFPLKKWISNDAELLKGNPETDRLVKESLSWTPIEETHPTLGLRWNHLSDSFFFTVRPTTYKTTTKRSILAQAAQLFDPLGWLTPISTHAKITIQSTWLLNVKWDDPLHEHIAKEWNDFHNQWDQLSEIQIPRWLHKNDINELHGFADASEQAYAAVLYLRAMDKQGHTKVSLVTAKSKVALLKQVSLPRLELCAANLLAKLTYHTLKMLNVNNLNTVLWTDSTVTLGWIQAPPRKWKTYIANRVAEIQTLVPNAHWNHIPGQHNPADCASRGLSPRNLLSHKLWWHGPEFLSTSKEPPRNKTRINLNELPEGRITAQAVTTRGAQTEHELLNQFSQYRKLLRITAWCRRWLPQNRTTGYFLPPIELRQAELTWVRLVQSQHFKKELQTIKADDKIHRKSALISLTPYLDNEGFLRVGGRLKHSLLAFDEKHPIILPQKSKFSSMLIDYLHEKILHGGVQLTLGTLRQRYWIPRGRNFIKTRIHQCITYVRWRAAPSQQLMADLPQSRVPPARPFQFAGVDYGGPISLKTSPGRGHKTKKAFLVIFICMVTKAVHLDIASDYSTQAFIAALKRFVSRRGLCTKIYSDRGTNFVGTDAELRKLIKQTVNTRTPFTDELSHLGITWRFNPPAAPYFGGLWEAAVKSTKFHLRRVIGDATSTYEEMSTVLSQIEACLNSRPLNALSDDPEDLNARTFSHWLTPPTLCQSPYSWTSQHLDYLAGNNSQKCETNFGHDGHTNTFKVSHQGENGINKRKTSPRDGYA